MAFVVGLYTELAALAAFSFGFFFLTCQMLLTQIEKIYTKIEKENQEKTKQTRKIALQIELLRIVCR